MPDGTPPNWSKPGHYSPPARNQWIEGDSKGRQAPGGCQTPPLTPGGPPLAGVWPATMTPDDPARRWTYWIEADGTLHACFPGVVADASGPLGSGGASLPPTTVGPVAPSSPGIGDLWFNTTLNVMNVWNGSAWVAADPSTVHVGPAAPDNPATGALWFDTTENVLLTWTGAAWASEGPFMPLSAGPFVPATGVTDGSPAAAGFVGEVIRVDFANAAMTLDGNPRPTAVLTVPPGDWDITGWINVQTSSWQGVGSGVSYVFGLGSTEDLAGGTQLVPEHYGFFQYNPAPSGNVIGVAYMGPLSVCVAAETDYLIAAIAGFSNANDVKAWISARRMR